MDKFIISTEVFERYMDASVELFMECYAETITVNIDDKQPEDCSYQLQEKCKALIKATHRRQRFIGVLSGGKKVLKSAAVLAIALFSLSSFLFITVEAVRKPVIDFYIEKNDGNWKLRNSPFDFNTENTAPEASFNEKDPLGALLPDDFHLDSIEGNLTESLMAIYCDDDQKVISFSSVCSDSISHINTENADVERLRIGEYDAVLSIRKDDNSAVLVWYNSDLEIVLTLKTDTFSKDELIRIAQIVNQQLMH